MKYIAIHNQNKIVDIREIDTNTTVVCDHSSTIRNSREELNTTLRSEGYTQSEIDEKMPVEETDE